VGADEEAACDVARCTHACVHADAATAVTVITTRKFRSGACAQQRRGAQPADAKAWRRCVPRGEVLLKLFPGGRFTFLSRAAFVLCRPALFQLAKALPIKQLSVCIT
jgi:hypothetical protein